MYLILFVLIFFLIRKKILLLSYLESLTGGSRAFRHTKLATVHFAIGLFATGFFATGFFATCHWDFSPQTKKLVANSPI